MASSAVGRPGQCHGAENLQFVGYAGGGPQFGCSGCERPAFVFCVVCKSNAHWPCNTTRQSRCAPCARRYRHRVEMVCQSGMLGRVGYCLTLTAPGQNPHCFRHKRKGCQDPSCDLCPCTPAGGVNLQAWNVDLTSRMNRLLEAIRRGEASPLVRGKRQQVPLEYFQAREVQRRGALHTHVPLVRSDGKPLHLDKRQLRQLAMRHGFGHAMTYKPFAKGLAYYCAKYVAKGADQRTHVPWLYGRRNKRGEATYRTWTRSRGFGKSMRQVREELCNRWRQTEEAKPTLDSFMDSYASESLENSAVRLLNASFGPIDPLLGGWFTDDG